MIPLAELTARYAQAGRIEAILLRPARLAEPMRVEAASLTETGLDGDHARPGKRALTLVQAEHLPAIAALAGRAEVAPELLRRNLVISRLNLAVLRGKALRLGTARIEITGPCAPCSRMEAALGHGGYTAMRGHGGWCARVLAPGELRVGDALNPD
ncbi:MAG: MOSC domain-containing protein [Pseudomonadota bacterium]